MVMLTNDSRGSGAVLGTCREWGAVPTLNNSDINVQKDPKVLEKNVFTILYFLEIFDQHGSLGKQPSSDPSAACGRPLEHGDGCRTSNPPVHDLQVLK
jgi:hypothetical protein